MLVRYAVVVAAMSLVHCAYGPVRTRDPRFLLIAVYGFLHAALLIPVRMRALFTPGDSSWGTRGRAATTAPVGGPDVRSGVSL